MQIAVVATARKLAVLCWTMIERGEDYAFARPSLTDKKLRALELRAGAAVVAPNSEARDGGAALLVWPRIRLLKLVTASQRFAPDPGRMI